MAYFWYGPFIGFHTVSNAGQHITTEEATARERACEMSKFDSLLWVVVHRVEGRDNVVAGFEGGTEYSADETQARMGI
jgi:hypothetical protein